MTTSEPPMWLQSELEVVLTARKAIEDIHFENDRKLMIDRWCFNYYDRYEALIKAVKADRLDIVIGLCLVCGDMLFKKTLVKAMDFAAANGQIKIVKWLNENKTEGCTTYAMDAAAANGHIEVVKYLNKNSIEGCTPLAMDFAAANGHIEVVKWLHENNQEGCSKYAMDTAASNGYLDVVKWLHLNRTEGCTTKAMKSAIENSHYKVIKYLLEIIEK